MIKKYLIKVVCSVLCISLIASLFSGCAGKTDEKLEYNILEDGTVEITSYTDSTTRTVVEVPDEIEGKPVVKICDFGIFNSESIEKIIIGKNVTEIESWAFTNNQGLKEFEVNKDNTAFVAVDGVLFTKDMKTIVAYPPAKNITFDKYKTALDTTTYVIPDGVEVIRGKAFYKCYYVTDITIPSTVTTIEEKAFFKTTALKSLTLPESLAFIGKDAFAHCSEITELTIPASVKQIDEYAFYNCTGVKTVTIFAQESSMKLGKKWYPTNNGSDIKELKTIWS